MSLSFSFKSQKQVKQLVRLPDIYHCLLSDKKYVQNNWSYDQVYEKPY